MSAATEVRVQRTGTFNGWTLGGTYETRDGLGCALVLAVLEQSESAARIVGVLVDEQGNQEAADWRADGRYFIHSIGVSGLDLTRERIA